MRLRERTNPRTWCPPSWASWETRPINPRYHLHKPNQSFFQPTKKYIENQTSKTHFTELIIIMEETNKLSTWTQVTIHTRNLEFQMLSHSPGEILVLIQNHKTLKNPNHFKSIWLLTCPCTEYSNQKSNKKMHSNKPKNDRGRTWDKEGERKNARGRTPKTLKKQ